MTKTPEMNISDWIDLAHTKARFYQNKASEENSENYLSDAKAWLELAAFLQGSSLNKKAHHE